METLWLWADSLTSQPESIWAMSLWSPRLRSGTILVFPGSSKKWWAGGRDAWPSIFSVDSKLSHFSRALPAIEFMGSITKTSRENFLAFSRYPSLAQAFAALFRASTVKLFLFWGSFFIIWRLILRASPHSPERALRTAFWASSSTFN
ncbi:MAG: hypothetical protein UW21_C0012G0012 [Candidatus Woesebacteria bacterium GW2011_GWB1_44_11b]|uniref:Uncharacterized protein n=1 Tax=Candidatus Woesebacteria bacterium GW2011_GWB1_44_11b TaxID=1618580 RepID=A0A0G1INI1_9BACT|nr:MAG: hypothetical protein UW21_C0012G0012 [Candidatus Woesebacteria bacterium GW2011_GWB1_44_11b]